MSNFVLAAIVAASCLFAAPASAASFEYTCHWTHIPADDTNSSLAPFHLIVTAAWVAKDEEVVADTEKTRGGRNDFIQISAASIRWGHGVHILYESLLGPAEITSIDRRTGVIEYRSFWGPEAGPPTHFGTCGRSTKTTAIFREARALRHHAASLNTFSLPTAPT